MNHGYHGANHPVLDLSTGKVEITSMNHGFAIDTKSSARIYFRNSCFSF